MSAFDPSRTFRQPSAFDQLPGQLCRYKPTQVQTLRINRRALTIVSGGGVPRLGFEGAYCAQALTDRTIMAEEDYFRTQAKQCRWLASQSALPRIVVTLRYMAQEYEAKALALKPEQPLSSINTTY
jgi:hypothetical protein